MRSGTTLLRLVLDAHRDLAIPEETAFLAGAAAAIRIPGWRYGDIWFERAGWQREEVLRLLRDVYGEIFGRYAAAHGASRWGEKTPLHIFHMELAAELFPDARFVGVIRHPAAVVSSMESRWQRDPADAARYWNRATTELVRVGRKLGDDRFVLIRYEDLVQDPEPVLRRVCAIADLAWDDALLHHDRVQAEKGAPPQTDGWTSTRRPVDPASASAWTEQISTATLGVVTAETAPLARWLGYRTDDARPEVLLDEGVAVTTLSSSALDRRAQLPGSPPFAPQSEDALDLEADPRDLAERLARAERALTNLRRRRSVRAIDALRRVQRRGLLRSGKEALARRRP